jgi:hypothetical protein
MKSSLTWMTRQEQEVVIVSHLSIVSVSTLPFPRAAQTPGDEQNQYQAQQSYPMGCGPLFFFNLLMVICAAQTLPHPAPRLLSVGQSC